MFLFDMWKEEGKGMFFFFNFVFSLWSGQGQGVKFWNLVFLNKCIPYDSFKFPPSAQWLFCMFPIASPFLLYVLAPSSSYFKPYRQPKREDYIVSILGVAKVCSSQHLHHQAMWTSFYFRSLPKRGCFFFFFGG